MDHKEAQIHEMTRQAAAGLYNLAATIESNRRDEAGIIYRWCWDTLTPEQQAPWMHNAMMAAKDVKPEGVTSGNEGQSKRQSGHR